MNKIYTLIALLIFTALSFAQETSININGEIVVFVEENKKVTTIVTYVDSLDELESYYIANVGKGAELNSKNGQRVEITGTLKSLDDGDGWITVNTYKILKEEDEDFEDFEEDNTAKDEDDLLPDDALKNAW